MRCACTIRSKICASGRVPRSRADFERRDGVLRLGDAFCVYESDGGSLERATERCVGVGACRKTGRRDVPQLSRHRRGEALHARPRAPAVGDAAGIAADEGFQSEAVHEALDLCLSCKACKTECPVQVDMAHTRRSSWRSTTRAAASPCSITCSALRTSWRAGFARARG